MIKTDKTVIFSNQRLPANWILDSTGGGVKNHDSTTVPIGYDLVSHIVDFQNIYSFKLNKYL